MATEVKNRNIVWGESISLKENEGKYEIYDWENLIFCVTSCVWSRIAMALESEKSEWDMETHFRIGSNCHGTTNEILFGSGEIISTPAQPWSLWDQILWEKYIDFCQRWKPEKAWFPWIIECMKSRAEIRRTLTYPFWCASKHMAHSYVVLWATGDREVIFEKKGYGASSAFCLRKIWPKDRGMPYPFLITKNGD